MHKQMDYSREFFEHVELGGETFAELDVQPFWLRESPVFDDNPYWDAPRDVPGGRALFISGPSRNGNHLIHSMLDGHPNLASVPGEDSFLPAFFQALVKDREEALAKLRGSDNVEYILQLTAWGINKWKSLWELERQDGRANVWSGIQPAGAGYVTDYQDTVIRIDYPAFESRLYEHASAIRKASTFVEVVWLYMDALQQLSPPKDGLTYPYCWVGSGMRRELNFLYARSPFVYCVTPLRPFESYYSSFAKARFDTADIREDALRAAWEHWMHKTVDYLLLKKTYTERVVLVNFDHVVNRPKETATRICESLGVPFDESLLTPTSLGNLTKGNSSFPKPEEVRGTFYTFDSEHRSLPKQYWPDQYPLIWNMVMEFAL